jgi:hypothetical protein
LRWVCVGGSRLRVYELEESQGDRIKKKEKGKENEQALAFLAHAEDL